MWIALSVIGGVLGLVGLICGLIIVIRAFKNHGALSGILSLFLPYTIYYAFAKFEHPRKRLLIAGLFLGILGGVVAGNATAFAPQAVSEQREAQDVIDNFDAPLDEEW